MLQKVFSFSQPIYSNQFLKRGVSFMNRVEAKIEHSHIEHA